MPEVMAVTPTIPTRRLVLRPLALSDAPAIQRHFNNWNIIRRLASVVPWPYPDDGAVTFIRQQLEKIAAGEEIYQWVLVLQDGDGEAIGNINFRLRTDNPEGNRGFWLAEPYWNRGLMTEAISSVNDLSSERSASRVFTSATRLPTRLHAGSSKRPAPSLSAPSSFRITTAKRNRKDGK